MQQYLDLLRAIKERGTYKPAARENMPGTQSLFGYQFRHNLADGFPLLTTKKMFWKGVTTELLWFLRGDTNIKYLIDNGVNIWNEDAYQYYCKMHKRKNWRHELYSFDKFIELIKSEGNREIDDYNLGDCGFQYGRVWRNWPTYGPETDGTMRAIGYYERYTPIDQIKNLVAGLMKNPESRRHLVTAIDPANDNNLALYWCHCMMQFNCRPMSATERENYYARKHKYTTEERMGMNPNATDADVHQLYDEQGLPKYYLDCQLYQRSADVFLGVPFNIASYALLTEILAKICNMIPGEFIHTFGDVHIYDNHVNAVEEQLTREPKQLPHVLLWEENAFGSPADAFDKFLAGRYSLDEFIKAMNPYDFRLKNYEHCPAIEAELSTGLKK